MSRSSGLATASQLRRRAPVFAALGDETRLSLIAQLCEEAPCSISRLAKDSHISRQAITKHLHVLENAGIVRSEMAGRECLFTIEAQPLEEVRDYLESVAREWDEAFARLKKFVERDR
jgi:DNA-binding transcriptional ArsR family regulator